MPKVFNLLPQRHLSNPRSLWLIGIISLLMISLLTFGCTESGCGDTGAGCGGDTPSSDEVADDGDSTNGSQTPEDPSDENDAANDDDGTVDPPPASEENPPEDAAADDRPAAGNPNGRCRVPDEGRAVNTSEPDIVVGDGTPESCTSAAVVDAVAQGGVITFDCGPDPVEITMTETAKIFNDTGPEIVLDGGGLVSLSGGGRRRILYMNTCDQDQVWTTPHCQNQDHPRLTVQNLTFTDGNAQGDNLNDGSGGAIFVRGGRFKIVNCRFFNNRCESSGPDVGGAAVRVLSQYDNQPVYVVNSTFGGRQDLGNVGSNGGGLSSIGVSFTVINSFFSHNLAIGNGANPAQSGTPGGGSGGAIYNDGNTFTLNVCGSQITDNDANEGGGAIFFVSNDRSGTLIVDQSVLRNNPSHGFETDPGIFVLAGDIQYPNSIIE